MEEVEMGFKRWCGESKDESWGASPHVLHPALKGQSLERSQGSRGSPQTADRGRVVKIECHVACLMLGVASARDGDGILLL